MLRWARRMTSWASRCCNGMSSAAGEPGTIQAFVHALRTTRFGFPVIERVMIASADVAAMIFCLMAGSTSLSAVVNHTEPHHTPAAPRHIAAAI